MITSPSPSAPAADPSLLPQLSARLDRARGEIEARFIAGGEALRLAHEIVAELLAATEAMIASLGDDDARHASDLLAAAMVELRRRSDHSRDRADFDAIASAGATIPALLAEMRGILGYIGTCATATRITGAGSDDFRGFADDIARYAGEAAAEVARYSARIHEINTRLDKAGADSARAIAEARTAAPRVVDTLLEATRAIDRHRHDLAAGAGRTAALVRQIGDRVATVLSALQIGDITRQRIEHIQTGIALLARRSAGPDADALVAAATRLFAAQVRALTDDFATQTRQIVETIHGLGRDARAVLEIKVAMIGHRHPGEDDPMRALQHGIEAALALAAAIDAAHGCAEAAHADANRLACELLDNAGSIGNLRNVRDDIRCLAINAYLKSSRLGTAGRAVGVIATEMSLSGERLGTVAEAVLARLGILRGTAVTSPGPDAGHDIAGDLDRVVATLRRASAAAAASLAIVSAKGDTVVDRIAAIAGALDFDSALGDDLAQCLALLGSPSIGTRDGDTSALVATFSEEIYACYTMTREREVHREVLGGAPDRSTPHAGLDHKSNTDDAEDYLL